MSTLPPETDRLPDVLVVDDDPDLCELLSEYLSSNGLRVRTADGGPAMRDAIAQAVPDVVVMDLMMPGEDGLSLTRAFKAQYDRPLLMLSARGDEMDRIIGLEVGADDYLPKPFGPRELLARLRALLRRPVTPAPMSLTPMAQAASSGMTDSAIEADDATLKRFGPFVLNTLSRSFKRGDEAIELTTAEYDLLALMVQRPNRVLTRDALITALKGYDRDAYDRSIDNRVTRLRRKIEDDPAAPRYIRTVRGEGYLFSPQGPA